MSGQQILPYRKVRKVIDRPMSGIFVAMIEGVMIKAVRVVGFICVAGVLDVVNVIKVLQLDEARAQCNSVARISGIQYRIWQGCIGHGLRYVLFCGQRPAVIISSPVGVVGISI